MSIIRYNGDSMMVAETQKYPSYVGFGVQDAGYEHWDFGIDQIWDQESIWWLLPLAY